MGETWGQWLRRNIDQHHTEYVLLSIFAFGAFYTLHVSHDPTTDSSLIAFGREVTVGALTCLYGFMKGQAAAKSSQPPTEHTVEVAGGPKVKETLGPAPAGAVG